MGYNSVADIIGLSSFVYRCWLLKSRNHAKFGQNLTL